MPPLIPWLAPWSDYGLMAALAAIGWALWRYGRRGGARSADDCRCCGYSRIGLPEGRACPECGSSPASGGDPRRRRSYGFMLAGVLTGSGFPLYFAARGVALYGLLYFTYVPPIVWVLPPLETARGALRLTICDETELEASPTVDVTVLTFRDRPPWSRRIRSAFAIGSRQSAMIEGVVQCDPSIVFDPDCDARDLNANGHVDIVWATTMGFGFLQSRIVLLELRQGDIVVTGDIAARGVTGRGDLNQDGIEDFWIDYQNNPGRKALISEADRWLVR